MDKYEVGSMLICKFSGQPFIIERIERCKNGYNKYWVKGMGIHSASARNSKRSLKSLYVPAKPAAKVLYGRDQSK